MLIRKCNKYFVICVIFIVTFLSILYNLNNYGPKICNSIQYKQINHTLQSNKSIDLKYILLWTNYHEPFRSFLREGIIEFKNQPCFFANCYVTINRQLLKDVADFDVILFHGRELLHKASFLPQSRSSHQKYIFASMESSDRFPVCNQIYKSYFNWTWTYKLNSDAFFGYMSVKDKKGNVIGPKEEMHWMTVKTMTPINDTIKAKLSTKKIAAAWFVSNCNAPSGRDLIAKQLQSELAKYNMTVDIYGECGTMKCPRDSMEECLRKLETDYYFYLAFENSFADDYVTEKLLISLKNYAVPVVFGGANYTRFMPEGIYLTAQQSRIRELAEEMVDIINDKQKYYNFFKWHNHYSYHDLRESRDTDAYCKLYQYGNVIGPKEEMHWKNVEAMMPINDSLKAKLSTKKIAAAWFVSNCNAPSGRDAIAKQLQFELAKYNMTVDIYGRCGTMKCPRDSMEECLRKLETDYYFYLAFENSLTEDYVTEKLLHALQHYTVPVVYGGANYTRFLPEKTYLSAQKSQIKELAQEMVNIINYKQKYYDFFKWHNHYSYHDILESSETDVYCKFCALMNNEDLISRTSFYENFSEWWNPRQYKCH
ncbi:hypothetical protein PYW08_016670 [Mythimna loreyi]|uniref:Uncharacterized protein n=1 Tax=Mythimna loreyi TaxID=667449 RepID=A0ACC2QZT3_9NEOP|nr:hypothetical protein PYW08_016670 [Mythimna loreyi]